MLLLHCSDDTHTRGKPNTFHSAATLVHVNKSVSGLSLFVLVGHFFLIYCFCMFRQANRPDIPHAQFICNIGLHSDPVRSDTVATDAHDKMVSLVFKYLCHLW